jgi:hypothetical protein
MTCADVLTTDPQSKYTNTVSVGDGTWDRITFRARLLTGNPGDPGTTPTNWNQAVTILTLSGIANQLGFAVTTQANDWVVADLDITGAAADITSIRIDAVGGNADLNFEIDYIRLYKQERQTDYEYWASSYNLSGTNALAGADPDEDQFDNAYEYAFGGDPTDNASTGVLPVSAVAQSGGSNVLEYIYFKNSSPYSALAYSLEYNTDLVYGNWTNYTGFTVMGIGSYNDKLNAVTNQVPTDLDAKFIRTKVE